MKQVENLDDHLVVHDTASLTVAGVLGLAAGAMTGSPELGLAAAGVISATGIGGMRIGPVRRGVNRAALTLAPARVKGDVKG